MEEPASARIPLGARTGVGALALSAIDRCARAAAVLAGTERSAADPERIAVAYSSERHLRIDGEPIEGFAPLSGFFATADGWVRTHGNYPHHAAALRRALHLPTDAGREAVAAALSRIRGADAARAITAAGGICALVRPEDPEQDDQRRSEPVVRITRLGAAPTGADSSRRADAPLDGIRVLDLTRVIAGPVCTRTLALLGADVLRIDSPGLPEIAAQHLDTGHGKRSAVLDLRGTADRRVFEDLLTTAEVVVLGYRPAALAALGLSPTALAARRPGLIVAQLSAWGDPDLRGFDSIVQAASGIALLESPDGVTPGALPAQALDHSAGYLLAAAVLELLARRRREGGSWLAETSLRRVAAELLGMPRSAEAGIHPPFDTTPHLQEFDVDGTLLTTAAPAIAYRGGPTRFEAPRPWGRDAARWRER